MMSRIWLAAVLGVLLGVGVAHTTGVPVASPVQMNLPVKQFEAQPRAGETARPFQSDSQLVLISLLAGILVAAPFFLVAKRHV